MDMKRTAFLSLALLLALAAFGEHTDAQVEGGAIAAIDEPSEGGGGRTRVEKYNPRNTTSKTRKASTTPKTRTESVRPNPQRWDGFVVGDKYTFLNFEVISAEKPYYTRAAKASGAAGLVQVEVLIDTNGGVISARARTGNKLLHPEAERAALASKFNRPTVYGKPARAFGFLVYRFGKAEE